MRSVAWAGLILTIATMVVGAWLWLSDSAGKPAAALDSAGTEANIETRIAALIGALDPTEAESILDELTRSFEESIRDCMALQGFDYPLGFVTEEPGAGLPGFEDGLGRSTPDPEFVREYGYGITAAVITAQGVDIGGRIPEIPSGPRDNVATLPIAEQEAFYKALEGSRIDPSLESSDTGCYGAALEQSDYGRLRSQVITMRNEYRDDLRRLVDTDKRVVALARDWQACVSEEGLSGEWSPDLVQGIWDRLGVLDQNGAPIDDYFALLEHEKAVATIDLVMCSGGATADRVYRSVKNEIELDLVGEYLDTR